jgi:ArsR family transcriptional regulator, arsenate/arsenite/antimonite-responsive transcriptional repressor
MASLASDPRDPLDISQNIATLRHVSKYRASDYERLAEVFRALGNAHRLRIMVHLASCCHPAAPECTPGAQCDCGGEAATAAPAEPGVRSVGELGGGLKIVASTLSHHIHELVRAAVMSCHKHGKCVMCCIDRKTLREISALFAALAGDAPLPDHLMTSLPSQPQHDQE